jgi:L-ascorbate oxidase
MPTAAEVTRRVNITVHLSEAKLHFVYLEDGLPWYEDVPEEPYLVSLYKDDGIEFPSMARAIQNQGLDPVSRAFPAEIGEVLEIVLQNTGSDGGAHYWDLGSGLGVYDAAENEAKWASSPGMPVKREYVSSPLPFHSLWSFFTHVERDSRRECKGVKYEF